MSAEDALHFGLIPRMHRGIFAMNEIPELDELIQVGLFNILEERDVQIRGYPIQFDLDVLVLFSRQPDDVQPLRQGDPAAEGPHRLADPDALPAASAALGIEIMEQEAALDLGGEFPVLVPYFMKEIIEQISVCGPEVEVRRSRRAASAPGSASPTTARWSPAPGTAACGSARSRPCRGSATWATCRRRRSASSNST